MNPASLRDETRHGVVSRMAGDAAGATLRIDKLKYVDNLYKSASNRRWSYLI